ncbi:MAG: DUF4272 domain-containing protein [Phycisphaerales bacterium]|nr:DUF4272 domain-containing protein [Phycisphaerales bacterium]
MATIDVEAIKRESEEIIRRYGGQTCDGLPCHDPADPARDVQAVARRALVLNAMLQIAFQAPIPVIKRWISAHDLDDELVESERAILEKENADLTEQERANLHWYIEALWALAWVGGLIEQMPFDEHVGDNLAALCPNLQIGEDGAKFLTRMRLRPHDELYRMRDLYYRLHWWTRNAELQGQPTGNVSIDIIMERRKALEWTLNADDDWDNVNMST